MDKGDNRPIDYGTMAAVNAYELSERDDATLSLAQVSNQPSSEGQKQRYKLMTFAMMAIANASSTIAFSCIAPFYPTEARLKGASKISIGAVFGIYELTVALMSPVFGTLIKTTGSRWQYCIGMFITGYSSFLFGLLKWTPKGWQFVLLSILIRMSEACGNAAFITASFTIIMGTFPKSVASKIGFLETFSGLGFTIGPTIGGLLYEIGGFELPFWVLGTFVLLTCVVAYFLIPKQNDIVQGPEISFGQILSIPIIPLMCVVVIIAAASMAFFDPTLAEHLIEQFNLSSLWVGIMFMIVGGTYLLATPIIGYLVERANCGMPIMLFGSLTACIGFLFIGPSPVLEIKNSIQLTAISLLLAGISFASLIIPPVHFCLEESLKNGLPDSSSTFGHISGLLNFSFSIGGFLGPSFGSLPAHYYGFAWTCTGISMLNMALALTLAFFWCTIPEKVATSREIERGGEDERILTIVN